MWTCPTGTLPATSGRSIEEKSKVCAPRRGDSPSHRGRLGWRVFDVGWRSEGMARVTTNRGVGLGRTRLPASPFRPQAVSRTCHML